MIYSPSLRIDNGYRFSPGRSTWELTTFWNWCPTRWLSSLGPPFCSSRTAPRSVSRYPLAMRTDSQSSDPTTKIILKSEINRRLKGRWGMLILGGIFHKTYFRGSLGDAIKIWNISFSRVYKIMREHTLLSSTDKVKLYNNDINFLLVVVINCFTSNYKSEFNSTQKFS